MEGVTRQQDAKYSGDSSHPCQIIIMSCAKELAINVAISPADFLVSSEYKHQIQQFALSVGSELVNLLDAPPYVPNQEDCDFLAIVNAS